MVVIVWELDLQLPVPIAIKVVNSNPVHGEVYSIQHYVIKFVSDLTTGWWFFYPGTSVFPTDITEILLKVALNTINQPNRLRHVSFCYDFCVHVSLFMYRYFMLTKIFCNYKSVYCAIYAH